MFAMNPKQKYSFEYFIYVSQGIWLSLINIKTYCILCSPTIKQSLLNMELSTSALISFGILDLEKQITISAQTY